MKRRPFVLLDRDGTIIVERHYLADPGHIDFFPGRLEVSVKCSPWDSGWWW